MWMEISDISKAGLKARLYVSMNNLVEADVVEADVVEADVVEADLQVRLRMNDVVEADL
jgi:hypothetical protein